MLYFIHSLPKKGEKMKKKIVFLSLFVLCSWGFLKKTYARSFVEERKYNYKFDVYIKRNKSHLIKSFSKVMDEKGNPLYEVSPTMTFFNRRDDYREKAGTFDIKLLESISKIMYFGYGYQNQNTDAYYFATQYLIYKLFNTIDIRYTLNNEKSNFMNEEILKIEENIKTVHFSLQDFISDEKTFVISDSYIVDNFNVIGKDIDIVYEKDKIVITFLKDDAEYLLKFQPKNACEKVNIWGTMSIELLPKQEVCEKEYQISVKYLKEENNEKEEEFQELEEEQIKVEESETSMDTDEEIVEVLVPNTFKKKLFLSIWIILFGGVIYVFKK